MCHGHKQWKMIIRNVFLEEKKLSINILRKKTVCYLINKFC